MWHHHFKNQTLKVIINLTTECNAACPLCHRAFFPPEEKLEWTLDRFKTAFPPKTLQRIPTFVLTGSVGDPVLCPDITRIVEYIINNSNAFVSISTNGSLRTQEWWWNLGSIGKDRLKVIFGIDGHTQEEHARYRVNTNLNKILDNMETLSQTPAHTVAQTIIFDHNKDNLQKIQDLCTRHGAKEVISFVSERRLAVASEVSYKTRKGAENTLKTAETSRLIPLIDFADRYQAVVCEWGNRGDIQVDERGYIKPCCFFEDHDIAQLTGDTPGDIPRSLNLFERSFEDILGGSLFMELECSIVNARSPDKCRATCNRALGKISTPGKNF